ncbi:Major facilitator superfamily MFS_1 [Nostocoides japonicum T1-X7]|uniref:Major facilitator superfamily MFS_1 n=1 Tax=Nostocoides japonicum T1-X7 TaxID=1194083 RepID=A0A077LWP2_9MICO|nr:MFS transporter [Tetrasphaera japonica]CCH76345.1 Major facilitator superfamily MFS_1 [Tetrasphaera japonica T1-X7]
MSLAAARRSSALVVAAVSVALFADSLLYSAVVPVLPGYAERLGVGPLGIGTLFASYAVTLVAATVAVGRMGDRVGRRGPLVVGMLGVTGATLLFASATTYPQLVVARSLQGAAAGVVWTVGVALVAHRLPPDRVGLGMGVVMASMSAGLLVGPPLAGILATAHGFRAPFLVCAGLVALCALAQLAPASAPVPSPARTPVRELLGAPRFRATLAAVVLAAAVLSMLEPLLPLDLASRLDATPAVVGLVFGAATLAHLVVSPAVGSLADRRPTFPALPAGLLVMAAAVPFATVPGSGIGVAGVLVVVALGYSLVLIPGLSRVALDVRATGGGYAAACAVFNVTYAAGMAIGPFVGGAAADRVPLPGLFAATAVVLALGALLVHRLDARSRPPVALPAIPDETDPHHEGTRTALPRLTHGGPIDRTPTTGPRPDRSPVPPGDVTPDRADTSTTH